MAKTFSSTSASPFRQRQAQGLQGRQLHNKLLSTAIYWQLLTSFLSAVGVSYLPDCWCTCAGEIQVTGLVWASFFSNYKVHYHSNLLKGSFSKNQISASSNFQIGVWPHPSSSSDPARSISKLFSSDLMKLIQTKEFYPKSQILTIASVFSFLIIIQIGAEA